MPRSFSLVFKPLLSVVLAGALVCWCPSAALADTYSPSSWEEASAGSKWVTQAEYDAFATAIAQAQSLMDAAGADWATTLLASTPSEGSVASGLSTLTAAFDGYEAVAKPGTKAEAAAGAGADRAQYLAKTGDDSRALFPVAVACALATCVAVGAARRLKRH